MLATLRMSLSLYLFLSFLVQATGALRTVTLDVKSSSITFSSGWRVVQSSFFFGDAVAQTVGVGETIQIHLPLNTTSVSYHGLKSSEGALYAACLDCHTPQRRLRLVDGYDWEGFGSRTMELVKFGDMDPVVQHVLTIMNLADSRFDGSSELTFMSVTATTLDDTHLASPTTTANCTIFSISTLISSETVTSAISTTLSSGYPSISSIPTPTPTTDGSSSKTIADLPSRPTMLATPSSTTSSIRATGTSSSPSSSASSTSFVPTTTSASPPTPTVTATITPSNTSSVTSTAITWSNLATSTTQLSSVTSVASSASPTSSVRSATAYPQVFPVVTPQPETSTSTPVASSTSFSPTATSHTTAPPVPSASSSPTSPETESESAADHVKGTLSQNPAVRSTLIAVIVVLLLFVLLSVIFGIWMLVRRARLRRAVEQAIARPGNESTLITPYTLRGPTDKNLEFDEKSRSNRASMSVYSTMDSIVNSYQTGGDVVADTHFDKRSPLVFAANDLQPVTPLNINRKGGSNDRPPHLPSSDSHRLSSEFVSVPLWGSGAGTTSGRF